MPVGTVTVVGADDTFGLLASAVRTEIELRNLHCEDCLEPLGNGQSITADASYPEDTVVRHTRCVLLAANSRPALHPGAAAGGSHDESGADGAIEWAMSDLVGLVVGAPRLVLAMAGDDPRVLHDVLGGSLAFQRPDYLEPWMHLLECGFVSVDATATVLDDGWLEVTPRGGRILLDGGEIDFGESPDMTHPSLRFGGELYLVITFNSAAPEAEDFDDLLRKISVLPRPTVHARVPARWRDR